MKGVLLQPRDPLILRDGRPFTAGGRAHSLPVVPPSVTTGTLRTLAGTVEGRFDPNLVEHLLARGVCGPILLDLTDDSDALNGETWLLPVPRDAEFTQVGARSEARRMPLTDPGGTTDLDLLLFTTDTLEKVRETPRAWNWTQWSEWLAGATGVTLRPAGEVPALLTEERTHVSIDASSGTAADRLLFQTSALNFTWAPARPGPGVAGNEAPPPDLSAAPWKQLGLLLWTDLDLPVLPGLTRMGGEGRLVTVTESGAARPACPEAVLEQVARTGGVRVYLLTPAVFAGGWLPGSLLEDTPELRVTLRAAATDRPLVLSGWDYARGGAKPTRRLVPAGSVYYLQLDGDEAARRAWVESHWFVSVSDDPQDQRDGFGLAVLGAWDPGDLQGSADSSGEWVDE